MMLHKEKTLFWDIINCPDAAKECCSRCRDVLSVQNSSNARQVPEPWSGNMGVASVLIIGSNPAYVEDEVFPSKDRVWTGWTKVFPDGPIWDEDAVEAFFEGRFRGSKCPLIAKPYVDLDSGTTLRINKIGEVISVRLQNDYWGVYEKYCEAIVPNFSPFSFVITDFVHCKSAREKGVSDAINDCVSFMKRILEVFLDNQSKTHIVLLFGKDSDAEKKIKELKGIGLQCESDPVPVGSYFYKRGDNKRKHKIFKQSYLFENKQLDVYYNLPAPSGSNRAASPTVVNGQSISW